MKRGCKSGLRRCRVVQLEETHGMPLDRCGVGDAALYIVLDRDAGSIMTLMHMPTTTPCPV